MSRESARPTVNDRGDEVHPAWGMIGASRVSHSLPGRSLFDSDIRHQHYVVVRLSRASRSRDLMHDRHHPEEQIVEVAMSEAQWASFVSSMNAGQGVPVTIVSLGRGEVMPEMPHEPRLAETMAEATEAAQKVAHHIQGAFAAYQEKKSAANRKALEAAIRNAPANMRFAAESLSEHAENVVQRARADIEAMVVSKAAQLGLDPGDLDVQLLPEGGSDECDE